MAATRPHCLDDVSREEIVGNPGIPRHFRELSRNPPIFPRAIFRFELHTHTQFHHVAILACEDWLRVAFLLERRRRRGKNCKGIVCLPLTRHRRSDGLFEIECREKGENKLATRDEGKRTTKFDGELRFNGKSSELTDVTWSGGDTVPRHNFELSVVIMVLSRVTGQFMGRALARKAHGTFRYEATRS